MIPGYMRVSNPMSTSVVCCMQDLKVQSEAKRSICAFGLYRVKQKLEILKEQIPNGKPPDTQIVLVT
jgi:hypothetical protein